MFREEARRPPPLWSAPVRVWRGEASAEAGQGEVTLGSVISKHRERTSHRGEEAALPVAAVKRFRSQIDPRAQCVGSGSI